MTFTVRVRDGDGSPTGAAGIVMLVEIRSELAEEVHSSWVLRR